MQEEAAMGKLWQIWPLEMSDPTCRSERALSMVSTLSSAPCLAPHPAIVGKSSRVQAVVGYPWLYLHGLVTLALTGSALMWEMVVKFATVNCPKLTLGHPGPWSISVMAL